MIAQHGTQRAAVLHGVGDVRIEERAIPTPGPGELLVRVLACGICGSDVHYYREGRIGDYVVDSPMVLGHESAGVVVAAGSPDDRSMVGATVALEPGIPCGICRECVSGRYNLCREVRFFATPPIDGSLAEFVVVPTRFAHVAPGEMDAEVAAMAEPLSVGIWAARRTRIALGDRVLVTGAGPVGLLAAQVARARGAQVQVSDVSDARRALAVEHGFALASFEPGAMEYDVILECSGNQQALDAAVGVTAPAARVALIGMGAPRVEFDLGRAQGRELEIHGIFRYAHTYPDALALLHSGAVDVSRLITHRFSLEQVQQALEAGRELPDAAKVVVVLGDALT